MGRGLPGKVKSLLEKSREAALLAVEVYNKPNTSFRTGGYIVLNFLRDRKVQKDIWKETLEGTDFLETFQSSFVQGYSSK